MKTTPLKQRMNKLDKISQNVQKAFKHLHVNQQDNATLDRILKLRDLNSDQEHEQEQDKNQQNIMAGCIVSRGQFKKQREAQQHEIINNIQTIRSQTASQSQLPIEEINSMQLQKQHLQQQITELNKMKQTIIEQETNKTNRKKQLICEDMTLLPQILKLQQEKVGLENEINSIEGEIERMRFSSKQQHKQEELRRRNWKEEKKNFEQSWQDLEMESTRRVVHSFEEHLYHYYNPISDVQNDDKPTQNEQIRSGQQLMIDQLANEVEELLSLKMSQEQMESTESDEQQCEQQYTQRKLHTYIAPMQVIEEEVSVDMSFQL